MKFIRTLMIAIGLIAMLAGVIHAETGNDLFQKALVKQNTEGKPAEAIKIYQTIVQKYGSDRKLAAKALLQMAESYQKLGDAESQKVYQRIVSDYKDQKDALALAQARLGGSAGGERTKGEHAVWTVVHESGLSDVTGHVSPDGRFITFVNWDNGSLMLHDVAANLNRVLTPPAPNYSQEADWSTISSDGRQVVYEWYDGDHAGFRIATLQGSGFLVPRQLFTANDDVRSLGAFDLSPDNKWIAAAILRKDGTGQIALIAVSDGTVKILKSTDRDSHALPGRIFFSPDSRYIAYHRFAGTSASRQDDVFVMAIDGSPEIPAVEHSANDTVVGWSPDGARLLFKSDRTNSIGLWAVPIADGKVQGPPELLKADIGPSTSLGMTASGVMYIDKITNTRDIAIAAINLDAGKLAGPPVSFKQGFLTGSKSPQWSPDGNYLAYQVACNNGCIAIRTVATGEVRRLPAPLSDVHYLLWSPDGRSLLTFAKDLEGRNGIFQIDARSGEVIAVSISDRIGNGPQWSPDGKKVYFPVGGVLVERDLASGTERELVGAAGRISPDGQNFATTRTDPSAKAVSLMLIPVGGGQSRELLRMTQQEVNGPVIGPVWTPDSSAVIIQKDTGSRSELWLVPVTGGRSRKLDIDPNIWLEGNSGKGDVGFSLSPDGSRIAFQMGKSTSEVWALENFLPGAKARK